MTNKETLREREENQHNCYQNGQISSSSLRAFLCTLLAGCRAQPSTPALSYWQIRVQQCTEPHGGMDSTKQIFLELGFLFVIYYARSAF